MYGYSNWLAINEYHTPSRKGNRKAFSVEALTRREQNSRSAPGETPLRLSKSQRRVEHHGSGRRKTRRIYTPNIGSADGRIRLSDKIVGNDSESGWLPALHNMRMEEADEAREASEKANENLRRVHEGIVKHHVGINGGRAIRSDKVREHPDYKEAAAESKAAKDALDLADKKQRDVERYADTRSDVNYSEPMTDAEREAYKEKYRNRHDNRIKRKANRVAPGAPERKIQRAEELRQRTEANLSGHGGKAARAQRRLQVREEKRRQEAAANRKALAVAGIGLAAGTTAAVVGYKAWKKHKEAKLKEEERKRSMRGRIDIAVKNALSGNKDDKGKLKKRKP